MLDDPKEREQLKQNIRGEFNALILGVKVAAVMVDEEEPGAGDLIIETIIEELEKLRSKKDVSPTGDNNTNGG